MLTGRSCHAQQEIEDGCCSGCMVTQHASANDDGSEQDGVELENLHDYSVPSCKPAGRTPSCRYVDTNTGRWSYLPDCILYPYNIFWGRMDSDGCESMDEPFVLYY